MSTISQNGLQKIFEKILGYFAPKDSPAFTGTPTVPTPSGANELQAANVAYVQKYVKDQVMATITITQSAHQTITIKALGQSYTETVTLPKNTVYEVAITAEDGYGAGKLSTTGGMLSADVNVSATDAYPVATITIVQSAHQTITVSALGKSYTETVTLPVNTEYTVAIAAEDNFVAGTLSTTGGTLLKSITVSATEAQLIAQDTGSIQINSMVSDSESFNFACKNSVIKVAFTNTLDKGVIAEFGRIGKPWFPRKVLKTGRTITYYIGITPGKTYNLRAVVTVEGNPIEGQKFDISWSPEISQKKPTVTDY